MNRKTTQLRLESLDQKIVPAGGVRLLHGIHLDKGGILNIVGGPTKDGGIVNAIGTVDIENGQVHAVLKHQDGPGIPGVKPPASFTDFDKFFPIDQVKKIEFHGTPKDDSFTNNSGIPSEAIGGSGNDLLIGGWGVDLLNGGGGEDQLEGRDGNDDLRGGPGRDVYVFGSRLVRGSTLGTDAITEAPYGSGDDLDFSALDAGVTIDLSKTATQTVLPGYLNLTLSSSLGIEDVYGTSSDDSITGNGRINRLSGGAGNDTLIGGKRADHLYGLAGDDWLDGQDGSDYLDGGDDNDHIVTGSGSNTVHDGYGNDYVNFLMNGTAVHFKTDGGNDTVYGSIYADKITGSSGNDRLYGFMGNDSVYGGFGDDVVSGGWGVNTLSDGPGNDRIDFSGNLVGVTYTTGGGNDVVIGSSHDDVLTGSSGDDKIYGGNGNDHLFGLDGTDEIYGEDGNDWMEAGSAAELAVGGNGADWNAHVWAVNGATYDDIKQAGVGDCSFMSVLSGAAMQGIDLTSRITYQGNYTYDVQLFNPDDLSVQHESVMFDGTPIVENSVRMDPWPNHEGESWTMLYQRAYLAMASELDFNFKVVDNALSAVTGRTADTGDYDAGEVQAALAGGQVVSAWGADDTASVYANHAYTVMEVWDANGTAMIKLRNPWGKDVKTEKDGNPETGKIPYGSNDDGIIIMSWDDFVDANDFDEISIS